MFVGIALHFQVFGKQFKESQPSFDCATKRIAITILLCKGNETFGANTVDLCPPRYTNLCCEILYQLLAKHI